MWKRLHADLSEENSNPNSEEELNYQRYLLIKSYVRIREAVRFLRRDRDLAAFRRALSRPTRADLIVLTRIIHLRLEHPQKLWGNVRKAYDALGKALPAVRTTSARRYDWGSLQALIRESFRARAIELTSARYRSGPSVHFVPAADQRYALYAQPQREILRKPEHPKYHQTMQAAQAKHDFWLSLYRDDTLWVLFRPSFIHR